MGSICVRYLLSKGGDEGEKAGPGMRLHKLPVMLRGRKLMPRADPRLWLHRLGDPGVPDLVWHPLSLATCCLLRSKLRSVSAHKRTHFQLPAFSR